MIKIENGNVLILVNDSEKAIDDLKAFLGFIRYDETYKDFCKAIHFCLPTDLDEKIKMFIKRVTQEPKTGHWIEHQTNFAHYRECSNCKCYFNWIMPRNSYCPNCGTDMRI